MARFNVELPDDLIKDFKKLEQNTEKMMGEMTRAGAETVYDAVVTNMKRAFKHSDELIGKLKITKTYKTPSDGGINTKVAVYGYIKKGKEFTRKNSYKKSTGKSYSSDGVPASLVVIQREYGNSRGEKKVPIFRPAFNKSKITQEMERVQKNYIKG